RARLRARARRGPDREVGRPRARPRARCPRLRLGTGGGGGIVSAPILVQRFERERESDGRPGPADPQRQALDAFLAAGFPTRRDEAWRYTDLKPIAESDVDVPPREAGAEARKRIEALLAEAASLEAPEAAARIVLVDGRLDAQLSSLEAPAGLEIARLSPQEPLARLSPQQPLGRRAGGSRAPHP